MSPSAYITTRVTKSGRRYVVRYRRGGRYFPVVHAGSFKTMKAARERRDFVISELAAGRDPAETLRRTRSDQPPATYSAWFDRFIKSRVDVSAETLRQYRAAKDKVDSLLGDRDPASLTSADFQDAIAANTQLSASTLGQYLSVWRQVLDYADIQPNPARNPKVKLPSTSVEEQSPPSTDEWEQIRARLSKRFLLVCRLIECDALRAGEATGLTYGDIDFHSSRIRISRARTKSRAGQRWLPVPTELLDEIAALVPLEDRHRDRQVFPHLTVTSVRSALYRACRDAGLASYSPHDLRHRRISLWHAHGIDAVTAKTWAGHAHASMSLDVYGHVVIDASQDEWRAFWTRFYAEERRGRVVPVRSEERE